MSLRRAYLVFCAVLASIGVVLAVALIILTASLHRGAKEIRARADGLRVGEELEFGLVALRDARDEVARATSEEFLHRELVDANAYAGARDEQQVLEDLREKVAVYVYAIEARQGAQPQFEAAFAATRDWTRINFEQSRAIKVVEARWDRVAGLVAVTSLIVIAAGIAALAWWLRRSMFAPALQLVRTIERYADGERSARAVEIGAQELRTIAHQFNDMASTLEGQRAAQLTFLAGVAHDLRNPLTALTMAVASIPPDKPLPPEDRIRLLFNRVTRQIGRLDRMIFDLLDASRVESGNLGLVTEECDVRDLVRATADLFEPTLRTHTVVVTMPEEPIIATCDPTRIEQVLANLVINAVKYSPAGGTVRLDMRRFDHAVEVTVADEGIGMSPEDAARVFEPFQRATRSAMVAGLGLGLFVAKKIARAHGGDLLVQSTLDQGSTFTLRLPKRTA
jgi:two-component system, OmpR family, sensor histidine kinase MtrB